MPTPPDTFLTLCSLLGPSSSSARFPRLNHRGGLSPGLSASDLAPASSPPIGIQVVLLTSKSGPGAAAPTSSWVCLRFFLRVCAGD